MIYYIFLQLLTKQLSWCIYLEVIAKERYMTYLMHRIKMVFLSGSYQIIRTGQSKRQIPAKLSEPSK